VHITMCRLGGNMYCANCGKEIKDEVKFCKYCGTKVVSSYDSAPKNNLNKNINRDSISNNNKNNEKKLQIGLAVGIGCVLVVAIILVIVLLVRSNSSTTTFDDSSDYSKTFNDTTSSSNADTNDSAANFGVDASIVEDYSKNLDPNDYYSCDSGVGEFRFYYPSHLFNKMETSSDSQNKEYGKDIKTVTFYGSKGTKLSFSFYKKGTGENVEATTVRLNNYEHNKYYDITDILVNSTSDVGRIIFSGYVDSFKQQQIYSVIKVDNNYIYKMSMEMPMYKSQEEKLQQAYVTECIYRMCGFSGSTNWARTYQEFLSDDPSNQ